MAAESLIVTNNDGTTDSTFYKVSQTGFSTRFADYANTATVKRFIDIEQLVNPAGSAKSDVRTVTLRREEVDTDTSRISVSKVSFQLTLPKSDTIDNTDINNDISCVMSLMNKNFITPLLAAIVQTGDYNVTGPFNPARA